MAQIIKFPNTSFYAPVRVRSGRRHSVAVRVLDHRRPEEARWHLQFAMQRAASFRCLKGFHHSVARRSEWHEFDVAGLFSSGASFATSRRSFWSGEFLWRWTGRGFARQSGNQLKREGSGVVSRVLNSANTPHHYR